MLNLPRTTVIAKTEGIFALELFKIDRHLPADILRDYALDFEVKVESTLKEIREFLTEAIRDRDCYRELLDATVENRAWAKESGSFGHGCRVYSTKIPSH